MMKKVLLIGSLMMGAVFCMNNAFAGWQCIAANYNNPPSQFSGIAPHGMYGAGAKANAKAAAMNACTSSPLTRYPTNCHIVSCQKY